MHPEKFSSLLEMLAYRASRNASRTAFTYDQQEVTFLELWKGIERFAEHLKGQGLELHSRVIVSLPNSADFFFAFYGVQLAGGIAVPVFPGSGIERIISLAKLCDARIVVVPSNLLPERLEELKQIARAQGLTVTTVVESDHATSEGSFPPVSTDDVSFLQFTSGSTGNPKGVILTHRNLLTNIQQMITGMEITAEDIFVSWLPVFHDMGLILKTMVPFYLAAETHLLPTNLRDVRPWLNAIEEHRGTFTAAPDFAYRLCLRHVNPTEFDLSSLRVALNAAEPVRASTMLEFQQAFDLQDVMVAGYGLAEATVGVSMWKPGTTNRIDPQGLVSVGAPFPGVEVAIISEGHQLPSGKIGEIAIRSRANSQGYFNNPSQTETLFWQDGYLFSGDLGFLDEDGYLYIVSRKKNIIKRFGQTIAPQEIEEIVDNHLKVRFSAAVGVDREGLEGEQIYVFAEIRDGESLLDETLHQIATEIVSNIYDHMGFRPARTYLLKPHGIPLTDNGKIQHTRLKELYSDRKLKAAGSILYPEL